MFNDQTRITPNPCTCGVVNRVAKINCSADQLILKATGISMLAYPLGG